MTAGSETIVRIELPSGGWWELETRPRWQHLREILLEADERPRENIVDRALVALTTTWSFDEEVGLDSLAGRDEADVLAAMELLKREAVPLWDGHEPKLLAEKLFQGLVSGRVPSEFAEAHVMAITGWSWVDLQETPADVAAKMAIYYAVTNARETGGRLDLPEEDHDGQQRV